MYRAQGLAPLTSRLGFRPSTYTSKLHKRLREEVDRRHVKTTKVGGTGLAGGRTRAAGALNAFGLAHLASGPTPLLLLWSRVWLSTHPP